MKTNRYSLLLMNFNGAIWEKESLVNYPKNRNQYFVRYQPFFVKSEFGTQEEIAGLLCKFDSSYDWLMPVWNKFKKLHFTVMSDEWIQHCDKIKETAYVLSYGDVQSFFIQLSKSVEWYNQIKK